MFYLSWLLNSKIAWLGSRASGRHAETRSRAEGRGFSICESRARSRNLCRFLSGSGYSGYTDSFSRSR